MFATAVDFNEAVSDNVRRVVKRVVATWKKIFIFFHSEQGSKIIPF